MPFQVRSERPAAAGAIDNPVWVLEEKGGARAEVCPALGCNCFRWRVRAAGREVELLFATPTFLQHDRPTRSGIPVLFPFPNRIKGGRFTWAGKAYELPISDPQKKNAIHGFACQRPWRVVAQGADHKSAWVTAEFHGAHDAPETLDLWPADYRIRLTCRLGAQSLRLEAVVDNPDAEPLPFGLGYHPYYRVNGGLSADPARTLVLAPAREYWELQDNLPTGVRLPVDARLDLNRPRPYAELQMDDILTGLDEVPRGEEGLCPRGGLQDSGGRLRLNLSAVPAFRELVVFTPPHREAMALEPYTCTTDALNLQQRGVDAGLRVLEPGESWSGLVEMTVGQGI
jgi:aldose 1-epimerase